MLLNHRAIRQVANPDRHELEHDNAVTFAKDRGELEW